MNASVHQFPMSARAEARRLRALYSMRSALHALELEIPRIASLDNDEAAAALLTLGARLMGEAAVCRKLAEDFDRQAAEDLETLETACAKADARGDAIEAEEAAATRWDDEHR